MCALTALHFLSHSLQQIKSISRVCSYSSLGFAVPRVQIQPSEDDTLARLKQAFYHYCAKKTVSTYIAKKLCAQTFNFEPIRCSRTFDVAHYSSSNNPFSCFIYLSYFRLLFCHLHKQQESFELLQRTFSDASGCVLLAELNASVAQFSAELLDALPSSDPRWAESEPRSLSGASTAGVIIGKQIEEKLASHLAASFNEMTVFVSCMLASQYKANVMFILADRLSTRVSVLVGAANAC